MKRIIITIAIIVMALNIKAQEGNISTKNGLFVDALIGTSAFYAAGYRETIGMFSFNARVGSKWYKQNDNKYVPGFQMTWLRTGFQVASINRPGYQPILVSMFNIIPLNVGYTSFLNLGNDAGLELNLNAGTGILLNKVTTVIGIHINPSFKLRYKSLSAGIDLSFLGGPNFNPNSILYRYWLANNTYSLVVGLKF